MESSSSLLVTGPPFDESHDTALCIIPPQHLWAPLNRLRCLNDRGYGRWPPHVNLVYPFVRLEALSEVANTLCQLNLLPQGSATISLQDIGSFSHKHHSTIFLRPTPDQGTTALFSIREQIRRGLGWPPNDTYQPHLTVAQCEGSSLAAWHSFLLEKARLLAPLTWHVTQLAILVRDPIPSDGDTAPRQMRLWGCIDLSSNCLTREASLTKLASEIALDATKAHLEAAYHYVQMDRSWKCVPDDLISSVNKTVPDRLVIASYNVLAEFDWPPSTSRYPALVANIISERATADILVLQEVTDQFLLFLLADNEVCSRYPFSTHGPPSQSGVGPLPSLLNIVVLSKFPLQWEYLPSSRKHKGFAIVTFPTVQGKEPEAPESLPLVLAACHLSQGLTDGAIIAKRDEVQKLIGYMSAKFSGHPCIIAGDFNLTTSSYTMETARAKHDVSTKGLQHLREIGDMISEAGFQDTWLVTRLSAGESSGTAESQEAVLNLHEGEQGATFDPLTNTLTARLASDGYDGRPQRYDRILVNNHLPLRPCGFNMFGHATIKPGEHCSQDYASDHWGIRCLLMRSPSTEDATAVDSNLGVSIGTYKAPTSLGSFEELKSSLVSRGCFPTQDIEALRQEALVLLEKVLLGDDNIDTDHGARTTLRVVLIPVGSFGLGVWTSSSDVDCLCVGSISSKTFFTLAVQRLRKAAAEGVTILRRVQANSGTMLELEVRGIKFDLQYCAATSMAKGYPDIFKRPSSDPAFDLPLQTLSKLKPVRDLYYLRRSIPDMAKYRVAHLLIKAWAKSRGLYSAKFGLLGGIHITAMLVPVCKVLANGNGTVSTTDIVVTFFRHYAGFDWKKRVVFDPFFHKDLKYHRTFREPLCLLGWHAPSLNTAQHSTPPTVRVLSTELARASSLLLQEGMTWDEFLDLDSPGVPSDLVNRGVAEFLQSYKTYVKIDARYWGPSPNKGRKFLGWLESKCITVLLDIDRKIPSLMTRIWPTRFADEEPIVESSDGALEYHGCYLIGLQWNSSITETSKTEMTATEGSLHVVIRDFESRIRGNEKYYDSTHCWMMTSVVKCSDLSSMEPHRGQWWDHDPADSDSDEGPDMEDDELENDEHATSELSTESEKKRATSMKGLLPIVGKLPGAGRFRSAVDVLNRLRWDAGMNPSDYLIGYEDRFIGAVEKSLEHWKSEQTDEEFIPQHRILYFKRKGDGVIMWERKTRIDKIFGSG